MLLLNKKQKGQRAEQAAERFLMSKGLKKWMRNYHCRLGEVDLIMRDKEYIVFIEVRARSSKSFGGAAASVTQAKQQKISKAASHFLIKNNMMEKYPLRFDVIGMDGSGKMEWIKNAF